MPRKKETFSVEPEKVTPAEEKARKEAKARLAARRAAQKSPPSEAKPKVKVLEAEFASTRRLSQTGSQPRTLQSPWEPTQLEQRRLAETSEARLSTVQRGPRGFLTETPSQAEMQHLKYGPRQSRLMERAVEQAQRRAEEARLQPRSSQVVEQQTLIKDVAKKQPGMFRQIFGEDSKIVKGLPGVSKKEFPGIVGRNIERLNRLGRESAGAAARLGALTAVADITKTARQARIEGDSVGEVVGKTALRAGNAAAVGSLLGTAARVPKLGAIARFAGGKLAWPIAAVSAVSDVGGIATSGYGVATVPGKTEAARRTAERAGFRVTGGEQTGLLAGVSRLGRAFAARPPRQPIIEETEYTQAISRAARQRAERDVSGRRLGYAK